MVGERGTSFIFFTVHFKIVRIFSKNHIRLYNKNITLLTLFMHGIHSDLMQLVLRLDERIFV